MCATCKEVRKRIGEGKLSQEGALQLLGNHAKLRVGSTHFDALIDELLGVDETKQRDSELDEAWERARRG